jgi:hypothetical protein
MSFDPEPLGVLLASGTRADVHEWNDGAGTPRVVKIYRGESSRQAAMALAVSLGLSEHPHLVTLVDIVGVRGGAVGVVLPRLTTRTAASWLAERRTISAGECVTLLVPILQALLHLERRRLDDRVVIDARLGLDDVLFDERGAPVVTGARLRAARPGSESATGLNATACQFVREVLANTVGGRAAARAGLLALSSQEGQIDELVEVLVDLDQPAALEEPHPFGSPSTETPSDAPLGPAEKPARAVVAALREVRPRVWAATGVLAVSAIVGLSVVANLGATPVAAGPSAAAISASAPPSSAGGATASSAPEEPTPSAAAATTQILHGDDADAAARELLRLRAACLVALDGDCLAGVDQPGSAVLASDLAAVRDPALLARLPVALTVSEVVNRLGGAGLYLATDASHETATVLITRSDAGWRLRSIG